MGLKELMKDADLSNFPNHITFYGKNYNPKQATTEYKQYRKKWVSNSKNHESGSFPLHLDVEVTNCCNLRCKMCFVDFSVDTGKYLEFTLFKKIIDESSLQNVASIKYNYRGEPLLHPQLCEMIKYTKSKNIIETQFNTNAMLLDPKKSEELIDAGIDKIIISLDGTNEEKFNKLRRGADYKTVVKNIESLIDIRNQMKKDNPTVRVQMVCMKDTINEAIDFVEKWRSIVDQVGLIRYKSPRNKTDNNKISEYTKNSKPCHQLFQRLVIGCDGKITMCCGDTLRKIVLGDANVDSIADIWKGSVLENIRKKHMLEDYNSVSPCRTCSINWHDNGHEWDWFEHENAL